MFLRESQELNQSRYDWSNGPNIGSKTSNFSIRLFHESCHRVLPSKHFCSVPRPRGDAQPVRKNSSEKMGVNRQLANTSLKVKRHPNATSLSQTGRALSVAYSSRREMTHRCWREWPDLRHWRRFRRRLIRRGGRGGHSYPW